MNLFNIVGLNGLLISFINNALSKNKEVFTHVVNTMNFTRGRVTLHTLILTHTEFS